MLVGDKATRQDCCQFKRASPKRVSIVPAPWRGQMKLQVDFIWNNWQASMGWPTVVSICRRPGLVKQALVSQAQATVWARFYQTDFSDLYRTPALDLSISSPQTDHVLSDI